MIIPDEILTLPNVLIPVIESDVPTISLPLIEPPTNSPYIPL